MNRNGFSNAVSYHGMAFRWSALSELPSFHGRRLGHVEPRIRNNASAMSTAEGVRCDFGAVASVTFQPLG